MNRADVAPITGTPARFRRGHISVRLDDAHGRAYRRLYGLVFPLAGVPALKPHDFDGRSITLSRGQLDALNRAFATLNHRAASGIQGAAGDQEQFLTQHFKEMQFLS